MVIGKIMNLVKKIIYIIFPFINLYFSNKKIDEKYEKLSNENYEIQVDNNAEEIFQKLKSINCKELKRKKIIEDKGKSILLIITLSGTLLIGTINILYNPKNTDILFIIFIIGIIYLIISVFEILPVVNTIAFNDEYMEDIFNIGEYKNKNFKINFSKKEYSERIGEMIKNIKLNQLNIIKKSNNLSCTLSTLKICFILILIFLILATINTYFGLITLYKYILNLLMLINY